MNDHEAVERQHLEAIDDGLLADTGQPFDAVERMPHLAVFQGEVEEGLVVEKRCDRLMDLYQKTIANNLDLTKNDKAEIDKCAAALLLSEKPLC